MSLENNNDDKNSREKRSFYKIMDKQGFYAILLLCVAIVVATSIWVSSQKENYIAKEGPTNPFGEEDRPEVTLVEDDFNDDMEEVQQTGRIGEGKPTQEEQMPSEDVIEKENIVEKESIRTTINENIKRDKNIIDSKDMEEKETINLSEGEEGEISFEEVSAIEVMAMPVMGKLALPFAEDYLVYHETLDQWSTHKGIDIGAMEGAPVKAALDGEIVEIINDTIMGITITIRHNNELFTMYSNLSTDAMVTVGESVKKGQTISGVGKTASVKALQGPLLHFRVLKDDKFVDPQFYLGEIPKL